MIPNSLPAARSEVRAVSRVRMLQPTLSVDVVEDVQNTDDGPTLSARSSRLITAGDLQDDQVGLSDNLAFEELQIRLAHLAAALWQRQHIVLFDRVDIVERVALDGQVVLHFHGLDRGGRLLRVDSSHRVGRLADIIVSASSY